MARGIDVLVNAAAIAKTADFLDLSEADFDAALRVDLKGAFLVGQAAARVMAARRSGVIVNLSPAGAAQANPGEIGYVVSGGGLDQLTRIMALGLADRNIRVCAVDPLSGGPAEVVRSVLALASGEAAAKVE